MLLPKYSVVRVENRSTDLRGKTVDMSSRIIHRTIITFKISWLSSAAACCLRLLLSFALLPVRVLRTQALTIAACVQCRQCFLPPYNEGSSISFSMNLMGHGGRLFGKRSPQLVLSDMSDWRRKKRSRFSHTPLTSQTDFPNDGNRPPLKNGPVARRSLVHLRLIVFEYGLTLRIVVNLLSPIFAEAVKVFRSIWDVLTFSNGPT